MDHGCRGILHVPSPQAAASKLAGGVATQIVEVVDIVHGTVGLHEICCCCAVVVVATATATVAAAAFVVGVVAGLMTVAFLLLVVLVMVGVRPRCRLCVGRLCSKTEQGGSE